MNENMMCVFCVVSECECRGGQCDPRSGECRCPDGMTGKQCDVCSQKYSVAVEDRHSMHCESETHVYTRAHTHAQILLQNRLNSGSMEFSVIFTCVRVCFSVRQLCDRAA